MKEAAGEANMTVITIVLIAIVLGVGTLIVNSMMSSQGKSSACSSAGGTWQAGACYPSHQCSINATSGKMECSGTAMKCDKNSTTGEWCCGTGCAAAGGEG